MRIIIHSNSDKVAEFSSEHIINRIREFKPTPERPFVIGLPTGSTPIKTYRLLIKAYRAGRVDFSNVVTFNMDEYVGLPRDHPESYHSFMWNNFFSFINVKKENVNILNGMAADPVDECDRYEKKIKAFGGIQLFMGGLGHDGHIAFNEPGSSLSSRTRVKSLNRETIEANARFFNKDVTKVPTMALTVGVGTIMDSKEVLFIVTGSSKAKALSECIEGAVNHMWTGSALQYHAKATIVADETATMELRVRTVKYFKDLESSEQELARARSKL